MNEPRCPQCGEPATYQTPDGVLWDSWAHYWKPSRNEKHARMLAEMANSTPDELRALVLEWHDAFYREERRANALAYKLAQAKPSPALPTQKEK